MTLPMQYSTHVVTSIFHPTDFSPESEVAFAHALKLAVVTNSALRIMHVEPQATDIDWQSFPQVRATLARWGVPPPERSAGEGLHINKILTYREDPAASILQELKGNPADLIVLATRQHDGLDRLWGKSIAEPVARESRSRTLFIPAGTMGFIGIEDGTVRLRRILIPIDHVPSPRFAVDAAAALTLALGLAPMTFTLLHVSNEPDVPQVHLPAREGWEWKTAMSTGDVVEQILKAQSETEADLIVMASQGHQGFLDALLGSTTERVIRGARCPVFVIPAERSDGNASALHPGIGL
ncbi:MAG: universal stress protein [Nitrospiraceae bacterium]